MKNSNYNIGNRSRDLADCMAVPQPTAPPRIPIRFPQEADNYPTTRTVITSLEEPCSIQIVTIHFRFGSEHNENI